MIKTLICLQTVVNKISRASDLNTQYKIKTKRNFGVKGLFFSFLENSAVIGKGRNSFQHRSKQCF